jgi:hypothetical protein
MGLLRLILKPVFTVLEHRAASDGDNAAIDKIVKSPLYGLVHLLFDAFASVELESLGGVLAKGFAAAATLPPLFLGTGLIAGGCGSVPSNDIVVACTESSFGLPAQPVALPERVPNATIGFSRAAISPHPHRPTDGVYAPSPISGINIDTSFTGRNEIDERFAAGLGSRGVCRRRPCRPRRGPRQDQRRRPHRSPRHAGSSARHQHARHRDHQRKREPADHEVTHFRFYHPEVGPPATR